MVNTFENPKYLLLKKLSWNRIGGYNFGSPQVALNGQFDRYQIVYPIGSYTEVISFYCFENKKYHPRGEVESFHLRVEAPKRLQNQSKLDPYQIRIYAENKEVKFKDNCINFVISEVEFDKYLRGESIDNPLYLVKKQSSIKKFFHDLFFDNHFEGKLANLNNQKENHKNDFVVEELEPLPKYHEVEPLPVLVATNIQKSVPNLYSQLLESDETFGMYLETDKEKVKSVPTSITPVQSNYTFPKPTNQRNSKSGKYNHSFWSVIKPIAVLLATGLVLTQCIGGIKKSNTNKNNQVVVPLVTKQVDRKSSLVKKYDESFNNVIRQKDSVCQNLVNSPREQNYTGGRDSKWYKIDLSKSNICAMYRINKLKISKNDIENYKAANAKKVFELQQRSEKLQIEVKSK
jgi:hypothetical protein